MRRKIKPLTKSQSQEGATMENRGVYLYKKIMKYGKDAIDEIQTLEEAKEVITLMATHDTLRFMTLRSSERLSSL